MRRIFMRTLLLVVRLPLLLLVGWHHPRPLALRQINPQPRQAEC